MQNLSNEKTLAIIIAAVFLIIIFTGIFFRIKKWNKSRLHFSQKKVIQQSFVTSIIILFYTLSYLVLFYISINKPEIIDSRDVTYLLIFPVLYVLGLTLFFTTNIVKRFYISGMDFECPHCEFLIILSIKEAKEGYIKCPNCGKEGNIDNSVSSSIKEPLSLKELQELAKKDFDEFQKLVRSYELYQNDYYITFVLPLINKYSRKNSIQKLKEKRKNIDKNGTEYREE
jgi:hypothetical protein